MAYFGKPCAKLITAIILRVLGERLCQRPRYGPIAERVINRYCLSSLAQFFHAL